IMGNEKKCGGLKTLFIVIGAVVTVAAVLGVLYSLFKKYFKITFECEDGCCDCFDDECSCEPVCCCGDEPEEIEE
ncbi:MAG: hypothetical protein MJ096_06550, partial [Clostridia bacterium]|nr:hypothetical protein [Clostridia bacterium]